ncbi:MAG TPA: carboxypeptidase-like regulatory domain-containing protein, partial [Silvibacterium sp.]|nr:carboxypeptidase-like regulatory domain-containing protein [Silvibacterium sp.]
MTCRLISISLLLAVSELIGSGYARAQQPANPGSTQAAAVPATTPQAGGVIHGSVKSGAIPLPGVSITATNTLTGRKYTTATDARGDYSMTIPLNGRYVLRTELAAFTSITQEALLNATSHDQKVDFTLTLASRAVQEEQQQTATTRQYSGRGTTSLSLADAATGLIEAAGGSSGSSASLPSLASNPDVSSESVAVAGQNGSTNPFAGINFGDGPIGVDSSGGQPVQIGPGAGGPGGPGDGGGGGGFSVRSGGGGFGGGGFGGGGRGFGGRGNFRNFNPNKPHGAFFWNGGDSALNALPFALRGQPGAQPSYASNRFGLTFIGAPYIPHLITHDTKDFIFFTLSGQRSSSPFDQYGTVPLDAERAGNFQGLTTPGGVPITIYDPGCYPGDPNAGKPFPNNTIPSQCISPQATALLKYVPEPNLFGSTQNYHLLTSAQTNTTTIGARFIHNFGSGGNNAALGNFIRQRLGQASSPGLHQNVNLNFNYSHSAQDNVNLFPDLGGKQQSTQYSLQVGYSISKGHLANMLNLNWNRTNAQTTNYFTNTTDVASQIGLNGLPSAPQLYGLPNVTLNQFTSLSEQQPNFQINQTISLSESLSWIHKKNNIRVGGDYRRVHLDMVGQTNSTGTYIFTGLYT